MLIFPRLETERLILRQLRVEDFPALIQYVNNPRVTENLVGTPNPYREPDAAMRLSYVVRGFKDKTRFVFAIESKDRKELVGEISLHLLDQHREQAQLAYWLGEPFWRQGIMTEAAKKVLQFGFEQLELGLIYADAYAHNPGSLKVIERIGMDVPHDEWPDQTLSHFARRIQAGANVNHCQKDGLFLPSSARKTTTLQHN